MTTDEHDGKSVHVRDYTRIRFHNLEHVVQHWRRPPGSGSDT